MMLVLKCQIGHVVMLLLKAILPIYIRPGYSSKKYVYQTGPIIRCFMMFVFFLLPAFISDVDQPSARDTGLKEEG